MRIEKSNISMAATRTYQTEAEEVMVAEIGRAHF